MRIPKDPVYEANLFISARFTGTLTKLGLYPLSDTLEDMMAQLDYIGSLGR